MQLQAILLPPPEVIDGVLTAAKSVAIDRPADEEAAGKGVARLFKKGSRLPPLPPLEIVPIATPSVKVVRFGNVTNDDAERLGEALSKAAGEWRALNLHVVGIRVEQTSTQFLLTAELGGDTDLAWSLFRSVNDVARTQRFFLDRRSFQPAFAFASMTIGGEPNPTQLATVPEFALGDAESYTGPPWHATYLDLVSVPFAPNAPLEAVSEIPLVTGD